MLLLLLLDFCSTQNQTIVFVVDFFGVVLGGKAIVFLDQFVLQFGTFRLNRAVRERLNSIHDAGTGKVLVLLAVRIHAPEFVHGVDIVGNSAPTIDIVVVVVQKEALFDERERDEQDDLENEQGRLRQTKTDNTTGACRQEI